MTNLFSLGNIHLNYKSYVGAYYFDEYYVYLRIILCHFVNICNATINILSTANLKCVMENWLNRHSSKSKSRSRANIDV